MRIRIRSSNLRVPGDGGGGDGSVAFGRRERIGSATAVAPEGAEARGKRGRTGSAQPLLVRAGVRERTGRATGRIRAFGRRDRTGEARPGVLPSITYSTSYVLAAQTDLPTVTLTNYVVRFHIAATYLKQVANGGRIVHAQAWDILVQSVDGTTQIDHEIEFYDGIAGIIDLNIRLPSWTSNVQYPFRLRYGSLT